VDQQLRGLGQRIKQLRTERGWSQEEFAEICGVHRTYMGHIERGEKNLSFGSIARVANALDVSLSELFKGLESGESFSSAAETRHGRGQNSGGSRLNRDRLIREVASLERILRALKELVSSSERRTRSAKPSRKEEEK
jgi:transcriptional regulator with XRE-family HTH domain